jgi:hypothetical protein
MTLMMLTAIMNVMDALLTAIYLDMGKITEFNPIIAAVIEEFGLVNMIIGKIIFVNIMLLILFLFRNTILARKGITFAFVVYYSLMVWHLVLQTIFS